MMPGLWVVSLEWAAPVEEPLAERAQIQAILEALQSHDAVAVYNPDRYVLQLAMAGQDALRAIRAANRACEHAAHGAGLGRWDLVRAEVVTRAEFDAEQFSQEFEDQFETVVNVPVAEASGRHQLQETLELLATVGAAEQARKILIRYVRMAGGAVVAARSQDGWTLPVDLSFGVGEPVVAAAEPWSLARLELEKDLPRLIETARHALRHEASTATASSVPAGGEVDAYIACLADADRERALSLAFALAERTSPAQVISSVLAPAQIEVGRLWETNRWSVAQEHAATTITDTVLIALATKMSHRPSPRGQVVVVCAEGERHVLPARMMAELLAQHGWAVTMLGPAVNAEHLRNYVLSRPSLAVAVSCSIPGLLGGVRRTIEGAHAAGIPVLAGGRALTAARATALGADAFARDAEAASEILSRWADRPPCVRPEPPVPATERTDGASQSEWAEWAELEGRTNEVLDRGLQDLWPRFPPLAAYDRGEQVRIREHLEGILQSLTASLLVADPGILADHLRWLDVILMARCVPPGLVGNLIESLLAVMDGQFPKSRALLAAAGRQSIAD